jgi:Uma2 family endonuclease
MEMQNPAPQLAKLSRARYEAMIDAGIITEDDAIELLDGQLYQAMSKGKRHNARINRIAKFLEHCIGHESIISVQNSIALHEYSEPEPDICVLKPREDYYESKLPEVEDILILIEVSDSTLAYDRDLKIPLYAASDVAEVWLVDVAASQLTVFREPEGNGYKSVKVLALGDAVEPLAFPTQSIALADLGF